MRDLDKERELLVKAGLAACLLNGEAVAAVKVWDASAATKAEPSTLPVHRAEPLRATPVAETPLAALARLRREAGDAIEHLIALLDDIEGDPDLEDEPAECDLSTCENVSQLMLNADDREDDDDGEPSLAVPEVRHWGSQEQVWRAACRSRLRDEDLEPNLGVECRDRHSQELLSIGCANPALDELETDIDTEEGDDLEVHGELELASTECINQEHIAQGDFTNRDGEMDLASTEGIDQRWTHTGSRTDREIDGFPYDPSKRRELPEHWPYETRQRIELQLRTRRPRDDRAELVRWRR